MKEIFKFITEQYFIVLYLLVWLVSVVRYRHFFDTPVKYFPIYLMYTFLTEILGYLIVNYDQFQFFSDERFNWHNVIIYNIYSVITFLFFFYIYWRILKEERHKNWVKWGALLSMLSYLVSLFFQDPLHSNLYYAELPSSLILVLVIFWYFQEKRKETRSYPLTYNLMFWISLGSVIFYAISPFLFLVGYEAPHIWIDFKFRSILKIIIVLMYGSFLVGFIVGRRKAFG